MTTPDEPTLEPDDNEPADMATVRKLRRENAGLRERAHTAEERAHALEESYGEAAAIVTSMQRAEVERLASSVLHDPGDLLAHQPDLASYYDDEFKTITADKVVEAAKALAAQKPHLGKPPAVAPRPPTDRPIESLRSGAMPDADKPKPITWSSVLH